MRIGSQALLRGALGIAISLVSIYIVLGSVDLAKAVGRYAGDCPRCGAAPCACPMA